MRTITWLVAASMAAAASAASAQSASQSHEQHQATGEHQATEQHGVAAKGGEKCCCEEMMRDMHKMMSMMDMMHKQGIGMMSKDSAQPDKDHAH